MIASTCSQVSRLKCRVLWQCSTAEVRVPAYDTDQDQVHLHEEVEADEEDIGRGGLQ